MINIRPVRITSSVKEGVTRRSVTSNVYGGNVNIQGGPGLTSVSSYSGQGNTPVSMLLGILSEDEKSLQDTYKDIYMYDNICGTAADMKSTLAVSDFTLSGCQDEKRTEVYRSNLERLGFPGVMPKLYLDYYVRGKFISTLIHSSAQKMFTDQMIHSARDCEVLDSPLYGQAPIIKLKAPTEVKKFFGDNSKHAQDIVKKLHPDFVRNLLGTEVLLDPLATMYIPRSGISGLPMGQSLFRRIVPIYLLEKTLYRGTIAEAQKRQRATLHIQAGSDNWQPVEEDLQMLVGLFQQADLDPVGAIVATRNDITTSDLRPGGDFWKYTDVTDITSTMKLRALGISETFLSGESSYNAMEVALSVFIENTRSDRDYVTREAFTKHLFPLIAHVNNFRLDEKTRHHAVLANADIQFDIADTSKLDIPKLHWHKSLRPEADRDYLEVLDTLGQKGVPVPIAMMAAAGGISMEELIKGFDEDLKYREALFKHAEAMGKFKPKNEEDASLLEMSRGRMGVFSRNSDRESDPEIFDRTVTGKKKAVYDQRGRRNKINKVCAAALKRLATDDLAWSRGQASAKRIRANGRIVHNDGSTT